MRILQLHSDFISYKPIQKEISLAEDAGGEEVKIGDVVVLFTAIEKGDDEATVKKAVNAVHSFLQKLKANRILIYPYAHLSNNLATPRDALRLVKLMEAYAEKKDLETHRAPFGWNKQFTLSIKGHPLSEQSRVFLPTSRVKEKVSEALKAEEKLRSTWYIHQLDGKLVPVSEFVFKGHENLEKFMKYEISKTRASQRIPPHVILMKKLGITDYEPGSDPGNLRWYPKGRLIKSLLEQFVTDEVTKDETMEVETPVMYDFQHPSLADYLNRFPARQYVLKSEDKDLFLRFAACFGQFLMIRDTLVSYRNMPLKVFELSRYSFRREQRGEVVGLRRLRAFTMPDWHAFCTTLSQAKEEFKRRFNASIQILKKIGLPKSSYEAAIRFTEDFYNENKVFIGELVKNFGKPVLIEVWKERFFYFILKWDFNFIDNQDKAAALSTDQIDVENAKRYGITYVDEKGEQHHPLILHCSPSGAIERCVYALLENAYREQQNNRPPMLPIWLSPTQIRLIPMSGELVKYSTKLADSLEKKQIRVDIDDRNLTLRKKVREAETEWTPFIIVLGQKEIKSKLFPVRDRRVGRIRKMKLEELTIEINKTVKGMPFRSLPLPRYLSQRPQFPG
ncbi:MAG: threonine--tRNA ligase [Candidatus Bathyarchaeota archaeon]|jgi:threonyl-tRNA synthetase